MVECSFSDEQCSPWVSFFLYVNAINIIKHALFDINVLACHAWFFLFSEGGGMRVGNDYQAKVPEFKPGIFGLNKKKWKKTLCTFLKMHS